jgi:hypothetical protein
LTTSMVNLAGTPLAGHFGFEHASARKTRALHAARHWLRALPRSVGLRRPQQSVFIDAKGVWSWAAGDALTPATRVDNMDEWFARHPGTNLAIWTSAQLLHNLGCDAATARIDDAAFDRHARQQLLMRHGEDARQWPTAMWRTRSGRGVCALAGLDLPAVWRQAQRHDVRVQSIIPWWYHAYKTALQCVGSLRDAPSAAVCIVEADQVAWIACSNGAMTSIVQRVLEAPTVAALAHEVNILRSHSARPVEPIVLLGQGIEDGANMQQLPGLVLGRLDGQQPPVWLRPDGHFDRC